MSAKYLDLYKFLVVAIKSCRIPDSWKKLQKCDLLLVRHDHDCGYNYKGKAYGHLIDTIGDLFNQLGLIVRTVATPYSILTGISAHNSPVSYNRANLIIFFWGIIIKLARGQTFRADWVKKRKIFLWEKILQRAKPYCVIGIMPEDALCQACKKNNVKVYDLQHGVISDDHYWYSHKTRAVTDPNDLPNCYLCWDSKSKDTIQKWALKKNIDVMIIGNPWFLRFADPQFNDLLVQEAVSLGKIFNNDKPTIVFSLQWGMDQDYHESDFNGVMVPAIEKVILETQAIYNWLLRLHPGQLRGPEKKMALTYLKNTFKEFRCIDWEKCSHLPLPLVLQQADLHITDASTVVIEASWFGIKSGLLNKHFKKGGKHYNYYLYERETGIAELLPQNSEEIKCWITGQLSIPHNEPVFQVKSKNLYSFLEETVNSIAKKQTFI